MKRWKRRHESPDLLARLASRLLDDALHVFGALQACLYDDEPLLDDELQGLFRTTALDLLEDVATFARLAVMAPEWPVWPQQTPRRPAASDAPAAYPALNDLAYYTETLGASALVLRRRRSEAAATFARLAASADARMAVLRSV